MRKFYIYRNKETGLYLKHNEDDVSDIDVADTFSITQYKHFFIDVDFSNYKEVLLEDERKRLLRISKLNMIV